MPYKNKDEERARRRERYATDPEFRAMIDAANKKWRAENRERSNEYQRDWKRQRRKDHPEKFRAQDLKKMFKVTPEWYAAKEVEQGGCCAICKQPESEIHCQTKKVMRLAIDHDHKCCSGPKSCGKCVRGLVCIKCNMALSRVEALPNFGELALDYLASYTVQSGV